MNRYALAVLLCTAPLFSQGLKTPSKQVPHAHVASRSSNGKAVFSSNYFWVLPHIVDGGQYTTQIVVTNLGGSGNSENYEIDFYDDNGNGASFDFEGLGGYPSLTGTLAAGQSVVFTTTGNSAAITAQPAGTLIDGWGYLNGNSGGDISIYQVIRNSIPSYNFAAEASSTTPEGLQPSAIMPFDNTSQYATGLAFTNVNFNSTHAHNTLDVVVYDQNANQISTHQVVLNPGQKQLVVMPSAWPETAGLMGSLYLFADDGTNTLTPPNDGSDTGISPLGFRYLVIPAANGEPGSQAISSIPVLQY